MAKYRLAIEKKRSFLSRNDAAPRLFERFCLFPYACVGSVIVKGKRVR